MNKAYVIGRPAGSFTGYATHYRLEPAHQGEEYVVVSALDMALDTGLDETFIFPADRDGNVTNWLEMTGSLRGVYDHDAALAAAGYELVREVRDAQDPA